MLFIITGIIYSCYCNDCVIKNTSDIQDITVQVRDPFCTCRIIRRRKQCLSSQFLKTRKQVKIGIVCYWFYRWFLVMWDNVVHFGRKLYFLSQIFQIPLPYSASSFFINYIKCCIQAVLNWQPTMNFIGLPTGNRIPIYARFFL